MALHMLSGIRKHSNQGWVKNSRYTKKILLAWVCRAFLFDPWPYLYTVYCQPKRLSTIRLGCQETHTHKHKKKISTTFFQDKQTHYGYSTCCTRFQTPKNKHLIIQATSKTCQPIGFSLQPAHKYPNPNLFSPKTPTPLETPI